MKFWISLISLALTATASAQLSLGYFPFNDSKVQLTTNPDKLVFADLRVETNSFFSNLNFELAPFVNLKRKESYNLYLGPGISAYPFYNGDDESFLNGYFLTVGVRWMPIASLRALGFIFELSPYVDDTFEGGRFRSHLGISYHFAK